MSYKDTGCVYNPIKKVIFFIFFFAAWSPRSKLESDITFHQGRILAPEGTKKRVHQKFHQGLRINDCLT